MTWNELKEIVEEALKAVDKDADIDIWLINIISDDTVEHVEAVAGNGGLIVE